MSSTTAILLTGGDNVFAVSGLLSCKTVGHVGCVVVPVDGPGSSDSVLAVSSLPSCKDIRSLCCESLVDGPGSFTSVMGSSS